jgi:hypothetical protein
MRAKKSDSMYGIERYRIELCDVLIALEEHTGEENALFITTSGEFYQLDNQTENYFVTAIFWNLQKYYEDQEESVKRFIHSVICVKYV